MHHDDSSNWSAFMAGALIGAGIALLLAPQSGPELRSTLRDYASKAKDELDEAAEQGRAAWDHAVERGQEYVASGKQTLRQAGRTARDVVEDTVETAKQSVEETTSRRG
ncbi:MAG: YtxH domain-containing protein [Nitrospira sp.]|nr:YtxH domain-containing protein [Nitrospira sp.]MBS0176989.1 YtxH domain-containing protein [Nitrospira sp.]MBX3338791.1 YtxH domain-containing protein [Nitrospira sp.]MCW5781053.1 YtxH domain-containing protein [Nitrospira sp.]HMZ55016.1 YtxH domain-containing protein [Nitrospira sp.]